MTETRQRLLTAARMLFSTKGYAASATAEIAREAKVSEGTLFYHFASKRGILVELGRRYGEAMISAMQGDDDIADFEPGQMISRCVAWSLRQHELEASAFERSCPTTCCSSRLAIGDLRIGLGCNTQPTEITDDRGYDGRSGAGGEER